MKNLHPKNTCRNVRRSFTVKACNIAAACLPSIIQKEQVEMLGEASGHAALHSGAGVEGSKKRSCGIGSLPGRLKGDLAVSFVGAVFVELAEAHRQVTFPSLTGIG